MHEERDVGIVIGGKDKLEPTLIVQPDNSMNNEAIKLNSNGVGHEDLVTRGNSLLQSIHQVVDP